MHWEGEYVHILLSFLSAKKGYFLWQLYHMLDSWAGFFSSPRKYLITQPTDYLITTCIAYRSGIKRFFFVRNAWTAIMNQSTLAEKLLLFYPRKNIKLTNVR